MPMDRNLKKFRVTSQLVDSICNIERPWSSPGLSSCGGTSFAVSNSTLSFVSGGPSLPSGGGRAEGSGSLVSA